MRQNHSPPKSDFSPDFAHFVLEILENLKVLTNIQKIFLRITIYGGCPPKFRPGATRPPIAPGGNAHDSKARLTVHEEGFLRRQGAPAGGVKSLTAVVGHIAPADCHENQPTWTFLTAPVSGSLTDGHCRRRQVRSDQVRSGQVRWR